MPHIEFPLDEIAPGTLKRIESAGRSFVIVRNEAGIYAYVDACPHASWPLSEGTLRNGVMECPGHGWEFDSRTGRCLNAPDRCLTPVSVALLGRSIQLRWEEERQADKPSCSLPSPPAASEL